MSVVDENINELNINKSIVNDYKLKNEKSHAIKTKITNIVAYGFISLSTIFTVGVLMWILGFIFVNGIDKVDYRFLTSNYDSETQYVEMKTIEGGNDNILGLQFDTDVIEKEEYIVVSKIEGKSFAESAVNKKGDKFPVKEGDIIKKINSEKIEEMSVSDVNNIINKQEGNSITLKVTRPGKGIMPMIATTIMIILLSLAIACPIGIFAAIYLTEYAKPGRLVSIIRFGTESLAGIPSIIYGLFGMILFVITLNFGYSIKAGALTLSIILLPVIIRQTEESLKAVPNSYREGSLGLGATKLQTIRKAVLPSAIPGIIVAVILSIGRIIGESAALLLTAGTVARIPANISTGAATLTVKAYAVAKEESDIGMACAIGTVVIIIILILNTLAKLVARRYNKVK